MFRSAIIALAALAGATAPFAAYSTPFYHAVLLQPLPGYDHSRIGQESYGINAQGQSVGRSRGGGPLTAFATLWDRQGNATPLATPADAWYSKGDGINKHGQVSGDIGVGTSGDADTRRAVLWSDKDHFQFLLPDIGHFSTGDVINDKGWVGGTQYFDANGSDGRAYVRKTDGTILWVDGVQPGTHIEWFGINNHNQLFGSELSPNEDGSTLREVVWSEKDGVSLVPLTSANVFGSTGGGINNHGVIAGNEYDPAILAGADYSYWRDTNGQFHLLPFAPGFNGEGVSGLNDRGQIVGLTFVEDGGCNFFIDGEQCGHAALWDQNGGAWDLNTLVDPALGYSFYYANAINNRGDIQVQGALADGSEAVFLLTPVPEPVTFALFGLGAAGLLAVRNRRAQRP